MAPAPVGADASCLLATPAFFAAHPPVSVTPVRRPCDAVLTAAVARVEARAIDACQELGGFPSARFAIVTFTRSGRSALLGFALVGDGITAMRRHEATVEEGAPSCWRVDDGCVFDPGAYRVPFVLTGAGGPMPFALWAGPEGQNLDLLGVKGRALESRATAYRYWAPL